jgi:hypothetical protein
MDVEHSAGGVEILTLRDHLYGLSISQFPFCTLSFQFRWPKESLARVGVFFYRSLLRASFGVKSWARNEILGMLISK